MDGNASIIERRRVDTPSGSIAYRECGEGPVALFVHGVLLNGHLWRHQLSQLHRLRRCIAVDLLAHGDTRIAPDQDVSVTANARMLAEFLDALGIDRVDLVGNDSGGGIAQIFAAHHPQRVRSLTLSNCDCHDNWPPEAFKPFLAMAAACADCLIPWMSSGSSASAMSARTMIETTTSTSVKPSSFAEADFACGVNMRSSPPLIVSCW